VSRGTVAFWHNKDGWGAITAPDRPGFGFVHFSNLQGIEGYRDLVDRQDPSTQNLGSVSLPSGIDGVFGADQLFRFNYAVIIFHSAEILVGSAR
jgi:cold shock CspA family protein